MLVGDNVSVLRRRYIEAQLKVVAGLYMAKLLPDLFRGSHKGESSAHVSIFLVEAHYWVQRDIAQKYEEKTRLSTFSTAICPHKTLGRRPSKSNTSLGRLFQMFSTAPFGLCPLKVANTGVLRKPISTGDVGPGLSNLPAGPHWPRMAKRHI